MKSTNFRAARVKFFIPIIMVIAGSLHPAVAALTTGNIPSLPSPDGQNITIDSLTSLEWVDPAVTSNNSVDDVTARFSADLAGFRYATRDEVRVFLSHFPLPLPTAADYSFQFTPDGGAAYDSSSNYFGITNVSLGAFVATVGFTADGPDSTSRYLYETGKITFADPNRSFSSGTSTIDLSFPSTNGHWLVQSVPEPCTVLLLGIGAISLLGCRKRTR